MEDNRLRELFSKWTSNSISAEEEMELMQFLSKGSAAQQRLALAAEVLEQQQEIPLDEESRERILASILEKEEAAEMPAVHRMQGLRSWMKYAAILLGVLIGGAALVMYLNKDKGAQPVVAGKYVSEPLEPNKATLILADGSSIDLQNRPDEKIVQGATEIVNVDTTLLKYTAAGEQVKPAGYNTLVIPRGGQYRLQLADGTEVWLNAATRLRYPAHFGGVSRREVVLESGEAYFKVKPHATLPFVVSVKGTEVQVLGTEFNVNAYANNQSTTLVNGSVRLSAGDAKTLLEPGLQGTLSNGRFVTRPVDTETYTAWKDGQIIIDEITLGETTDNLSRLYDFDFEFTSPQLKHRRVGGRLKKMEHIEDVLAIIEQAAYVKFNIKGRTILVSQVMPN